MLTAEDIYVRISKLTAQMISVSLSEEQNFPSLKELPGAVKEISISNMSSPAFLKSIPYRDMYQTMCENKLFNMKMIDGALIQMQYRFINDVIDSHRLAFFPSPNFEVFQNDPELYLDDEVYADIMDKKVVTVPLRFDYDNGNDDDGNRICKPIKHPISHFTIGEYRNCRIPVSSALTPDQFMEFIVMNFYNTAYYSHDIIFSHVNSEFEETIFDEEKEIISVSVPSCTIN